MKKYIDHEEQEIIESYYSENTAKIQSINNKNDYIEIALNTITNRQIIEISLPDNEINEIKQKADKEGIPLEIIIAKLLTGYKRGEFQL